MNFGYCGLGVCLSLLGCGRAPSDVTGVTRAERDDGAGSSATDATPQEQQNTPPDASTRLLNELGQLPHRDVSESERIAPDCRAPTSVGLSSAGSATRAARLLWDQETGECLLEDLDRSPEGMLGILTLRLQEGQAVLSSVGKWKFHAPAELDLTDVPTRKPFTIYPYLGDWQFVATLEHNGELLELREFAYLRGEGPKTGGERQDLEDEAPSEFVPPTLCAPNPGEGETP